jgi:hypothetical protein
MSFLKRLVITVCLLLFLGVLLSATYYDSAQSLPAQTDENQPVQQGDGTPASDKVPGVPVPRELQEENTG